MQSLELIFILVLASSVSTEQKVHCVRPNDTSPLNCPCQLCLTLDQYTGQTVTYFTTGSTFVFLAGNHTFINPVKLKRISDVTLTRENNSDASILMWHSKATFIRCSKVSKLKIVGLKFHLYFCVIKSQYIEVFLNSIKYITQNFKVMEILGQHLLK